MSKLLIISGGSRGIGKAAIALFIQHGWQAINLSRTPCLIEGAEDYCLDLSDEQAVNKCTTSLHDRINDAEQVCLIHNACHLFHDQIGKQDIKLLNRNLELSIISSARLNNAWVSKLAKGSSIFYIGSTLSEMGVSNCASYIIAKHAIVGMMRATCQDLANDGIHTACICPGFTDNEMLREHLTDDSALNWAKSRVGANRLITANEIAELLWFSANNPAINGAVLHANLGQLQQ